MTTQLAGDVLRAMEQLPLTALDSVAPGTSLILAPHPDDESLGCGGLIALASACGRPPLVVAVTDGAGSHPASRAYPPPVLTAVRAAELRSAAAALGLREDRLHFLGLPDGRAPRSGPDFDQAVEAITALVRVQSVTTVFATWPYDPHCDHAATADLAAAVAASTEVRLMFYPVWGWLIAPEQRLPIGTISGVRLPIGEMLGRKRRAIAAHGSQYSDLIADDPGGFRLPVELLSVFYRDFEVFLNP
jgi:LmbE family N-acetylglucosaminyl deacetylase